MIATCLSTASSFMYSLMYHLSSGGLLGPSSLRASTPSHGLSASPTAHLEPLCARWIQSTAVAATSAANALGCAVTSRAWWP